MVQREPEKIELPEQQRISLQESSFKSSSRQDFLSTRWFTKLVDKLPYVGDVVIQKSLEKVFLSTSAEELRNSTRDFCKAYAKLQICHAPMLFITLQEAWQDSAKAISDDGFKSALEATFCFSFAALIASVSASQTILLARVLRRSSRKLAQDDQEFKPQKITFKKPVSALNFSLAVGVMTLNMYLIDTTKSNNENEHRELPSEKESRQMIDEKTP
jgi:hypothetical protein